MYARCRVVCVARGVRTRRGASTVAWRTRWRCDRSCGEARARSGMRPWRATECPCGMCTTVSWASSSAVPAPCLDLPKHQECSKHRKCSYLL